MRKLLSFGRRSHNFCCHYHRRRQLAVVLLFPLLLFYLFCLPSAAVTTALSATPPPPPPPPTGNGGEGGGAGGGRIKSRAFVSTPSAITNANNAASSSDAAASDMRQQQQQIKLILISGCTGTGKSTFGMSLALEQGILKCISTDTVRAVMRSYIPDYICPALHRSSYEPPKDSEKGIDDDPVKCWKATCNVLEPSVEGLVEDAIRRGSSLVLEGVSMKVRMNTIS